MNVRPRHLVPALAALALAAIGAPAASAAASDAVAAQIGPNQYFTAFVNGAQQNAVIKMVCPGPATPGELGHPVAGQTVQVNELIPPVTSLVGYTGSLADSIVAEFGPLSSSANEFIKLTEYFVPVEIPTTMLLPCSGDGIVVFAPEPTSPTARSVTVSVLYANIAA